MGVCHLISLWIRLVTQLESDASFIKWSPTRVFSPSCGDCFFFFNSPFSSFFTSGEEGSLRSLWGTFAERFSHSVHKWAINWLMSFTITTAIAWYSPLLTRNYLPCCCLPRRGPLRTCMSLSVDTGMTHEVVLGACWLIWHHKEKFASWRISVVCDVSSELLRFYHRLFYFIPTKKRGFLLNFLDRLQMIGLFL